MTIEERGARLRASASSLASARCPWLSLSACRQHALAIARALGAPGAGALAFVPLALRLSPLQSHLHLFLPTSLLPPLSLHTSLATTNPAVGGTSLKITYKARYGSPGAGAKLGRLLVCGSLSPLHHEAIRLTPSRRAPYPPALHRSFDCFCASFHDAPPPPPHPPRACELPSACPGRHLSAPRLTTTSPLRRRLPCPPLRHCRGGEAEEAMEKWWGGSGAARGRG